MNGVAAMRNVGAYITPRFGSISTATAGGTGDATEVSGAYVNRDGFESAKMIIAYKAVLAQAATLSLAANIQDATDGSGTGVADFGDALANAVIATGETGGSTEEGVVEIDVDLNMANKFIRSQVTPNLSAANTDTCTIAVTWVLGGARILPAA